MFGEILEFLFSQIHFENSTFSVYYKKIIKISFFQMCWTQYSLCNIKSAVLIWGKISRQMNEARKSNPWSKTLERAMMIDYSNSVFSVIIIEVERSLSYFYHHNSNFNHQIEMKEWKCFLYFWKCHPLSGSLSTSLFWNGEMELLSRSLCYRIIACKYKFFLHICDIKKTLKMQNECVYFSQICELKP